MAGAGDNLMGYDHQLEGLISELFRMSLLFPVSGRALVINHWCISCSILNKKQTPLWLNLTLLELISFVFLKYYFFFFFFFCLSKVYHSKPTGHSAEPAFLKWAASWQKGPYNKIWKSESDGDILKILSMWSHSWKFQWTIIKDKGTIHF